MVRAIILSDATKIVRLRQPEQLERIASDVFDGPVKQEYLEPFLRCPRHVMFLAVEKGLVVGMISGVEYFHPDKAPQLFINEVGVGSAYRRCGIGKSLSLAMIEEAEFRKCTYAWLGTEPDNISANKLYRSIPDGDPAEEFVLYAWDLEED